MPTQLGILTLVGKLKDIKAKAKDQKSRDQK